jgi:hypothetical protein
MLGEPPSDCTERNESDWTLDSMYKYKNKKGPLPFPKRLDDPTCRMLGYESGRPAALGFLLGRGQNFGRHCTIARTQEPYWPDSDEDDEPVVGR